MKTVGILGGGQLGLLLAQAVTRLGARVVIYDVDPAAPARNIAWRHFEGAWTDVAKLREFAALCDVITYEFENVEITGLRELGTDTPIYPSLDVLATTQNRALEKQFLLDNNLPVGNFAVVDSYEQLMGCVEQVGLPCILKTVTGGYDGKGQFVFEDSAHVQKFLQDKPVANLRGVLEEKLELAMELSCIIARRRNNHGAIEMLFPIAQNTHKDGILEFSFMPADISKEVEWAVRKIVKTAAEKLQVEGLLTTEFFVTKERGRGKNVMPAGDKFVFVNEFAPRPHNSGHITMSATSVSQYDLLARILLNVPLVEPRMVGPSCFCMVNLLGNVWLSQGTDRGDGLDVSALDQMSNVIDIVIYGKEIAKPGRKMGHINVWAADLKRASLLAMRAKQGLINSKVSEPKS
jgi:5-(carboxyamino)imidazole ribonucleotide synthase